MNIVTIVITVVIINWNFRTPRTHRMPRWIRVVFLDVLPRAIMMTRPSHACRWYRTQRALCQAAVGSTDSLRQVRAWCVAIRRHFRAISCLLSRDDAWEVTFSSLFVCVCVC